MVSNIFYVHPYLGKISILTNIFQMGVFNHQPEWVSPYFREIRVGEISYSNYGHMNDIHPLEKPDESDERNAKESMVWKS